ncbi:MAG: hypothetical protein ACI4M6_01175 [Christensenellaceae bacterium]
MEQFLDEKTESVGISEKAAETEPEIKVEEGEVSFKKFKDVRALEKAYSSLEGEFTKRSQRLKELSRENDEYRKMLGKTEAPQADNSFQGQDNLIKLLEKHPQIKGKTDIATADGSASGNYLLVDNYISGLEEKIKNLENELSDESRLLNHIEGTAIKDKIIKDYLKDVLSVSGGARLIDGGGVISIAPPLKPRSIAEAGDMAREYLKK